MQLLRLQREAYPRDPWEAFPIEGRLEGAEQRLEHRKRGGVDVDLADCLEFCDKRVIVLKSQELLARIALGSKRDVDRFLHQLERLRDDRARAQDVVTGRWPGIVEMAQQAEH